MQRRSVTRAILVAALVAAGVTAVATRGVALHRDTPVFVQVTSMSGGQVGASASFSPETFAFIANGDVVGNGNASPQLFLFKLGERVFQAQPGLTQLTFGNFNPSNPTMSKRGSYTVARQPVIVFEADGMLCSNPLNNCDNLAQPRAGRQIFIYDLGSNTIRQATRIAGDVDNPVVSANGRSVVFDSTTDFLATGNTGSVPELYLGDLSRIGTSCPQLPCPAGGSFSAVQKLTTGGGEHGSPSFTANVIAFESTGDLANGGANPGTRHIYVLRRGKLKQITDGPLPARNPVLSQNGKFVGYEWDRPQVGGPPASQIFVTKIRSQTVETVQVTNGSQGSRAPSIDPKARRLSFTSADDLLGFGSTTDQIFTYNIRRNELVQVSGGLRPSDLPSQTIAAIMGFESSNDFTGTGNTTSQFFIANTFRQAPSDFPSPTPTATVSPTPTPTTTPTPTPRPGDPANIGLALLINLSADNGNDTLVTIISATVSDLNGNPVPDGTLVNFQVLAPTNGAVVTNGFTNQDPDPACNVEEFTQATGQPITNQPGVANACVIYPRAQAGTTRTIRALSENVYSQAQDQDVFTLPPPAPTPTPTPAQTPTPTP